MVAQQTVARTVVMRDNLGYIVREMHRACAVDVAGMSMRLVYLPIAAGFTTFVDGESIGENTGPSLLPLEGSVHGQFGGVPLDELGERFGWRITTEMVVKFTQADREHVNIELTGGGAYDDPLLLRLVRTMLRYGRVTVESGSITLQDLVAADGIDVRGSE